MASTERPVATKPTPSPPYHALTTTAARNQPRGYEIWRVRRTKREVTSAAATEMRAREYLRSFDAVRKKLAAGLGLFSLDFVALSIGPEYRDLFAFWGRKMMT